MAPHPSGLGPHVPLPEYVDNMKKIALHLQVTTSFRIIRLSKPFQAVIYSISYEDLDINALSSSMQIEYLFADITSSAMFCFRAFQNRHVSYFLVALQWTRPKFVRTKGKNFQQNLSVTPYSLTNIYICGFCSHK